MTYYYLDTCIWLDLYYTREYSTKVKELMRTIIQSKNIIFYSELTIEELKGVGLMNSEIQKLIYDLPPMYRKKLHIYNFNKIEAQKISQQRNIPKKDVVHALVARDNNAILITRDKDFEKLQDVVTPYFVF